MLTASRLFPRGEERAYTDKQLLHAETLNDVELINIDLNKKKTGYIFK